MSVFDLLTQPSTGQGSIWQVIGTLISLGFIFMMLFYTKILVAQSIAKFENALMILENMSHKAEKILLKKISKKPNKKIKSAIRKFLEFFVISPVSLDPYGIVPKIEHVMDLEKERFEYFVDQIAPDFDSEEKANVMMGLSGTITLHQLTKVVRHFVELTKKTKSIQWAMVLDMQLPLIQKIAKSLLYGTEALSNGWPVGDSIGPYVAAKFTGNAKTKSIGKETMIARKKHKGRDLIIIKAKGPGGRIGDLGRVLEKVAEREKIAKIITIDAAAKLEGEKTGSVAEGVGVAIGGIGVERARIEDVAVKKKIPLDSIVIKMGAEEAIMPMRKPIFDAAPEVIKMVEASIERTKKPGKIVVIGVGNTSGVGNDGKSAEKAEKTIKKVIKKMRKRMEKQKKGFRLKLPF